MDQQILRFMPLRNVAISRERGNLPNRGEVDAIRNPIYSSRHPRSRISSPNAASVGNFVGAAEPLVEWVSDCNRYGGEHQFTRISATCQAEEAWTEHVAEAGANILRTKADSWFVGANIPGKARAFSLLRTAPQSCGPSARRWRPTTMKGFCCNKEFNL